MEVGRSFQNMSEAKDDMENEVKHNFLDPLFEMQQKDLKEIAHHRKKFEGRRLDYDYKKNKGEKVTHEELQSAEDKFEESKDLCYSSMCNFMEAESEHISQLHEFAKSVRDYHRRCGDAMDSLAETLADKLNEAANMPRTERPISIGNASNLSRDSREFSVSGSNSSSPMRPSAPISAPLTPQKPCGRALYDFEAENEGELEFREGDMVELLSRIDENWLHGKCNGKEGYFPESFVEVVVPLP